MIITVSCKQMLAELRVSTIAFGYVHMETILNERTKPMAETVVEA